MSKDSIRKPGSLGLRIKDASVAHPSSALVSITEHRTAELYFSGNCHFGNVLPSAGIWAAGSW